LRIRKTAQSSIGPVLLQQARLKEQLREVVDGIGVAIANRAATASKQRRRLCQRIMKKGVAA
jgi:hypothetical protein